MSVSGAGQSALNLTTRIAHALQRIGARRRLVDDWGTCRHERGDAGLVAHALRESGAVVFAYSYDQVGAMLVCITGHFQKLGVMPFGGNPSGRMWVSVYGRGATHLSKESGLHHDYICEKLNLSKTDAEKFAEFYGWICEYLSAA